METPEGTDTVAGRLVSARWLLAASVAVIVAISWSGGIGVLPALGSIVLMAVVAAFAPHRSLRQIRERREAETARSSAVPVTAEALASAVADPLVIFDGEGSVVHVNPACAVAFPGLGARTSLPLRFRTPEMQEMIARTLSSGAPQRIDYAEKVPIERFFRVSVSPVGVDGALFVMVFRDQSETRRIDRMRADFIANASHELRTPLASISGFIETLRGPARNDPAARDRFLEIMQTQTARMARLIDDLLSLSRLEMKPYLGPSDSVDLRLLVQSVIDTLKPLAAETAVEIRSELPAGPLMVAGNRDELIQVIENLVENACKYGRSGGLVEVGATTPGQQNGIDLWVRDHGPGVPEEHIPRLTERFYRVDVETSRGQKGTGLGLSIVKHILTRHKARLTITSPPGQGATFTVHFPPLP